MTAKQKISELHAKFYGGKKKSAKGLSPKDAGQIINKSLPVSTVKPGEFHHVAGGLRSELMIIAKERGIKNFRVLNHAELGEVLNTQDQKRIDEVVAGAVARWKSGWGKGRKHAKA